MLPQVHHYDESKRPYTSVYVDVNSRKRYIYSRKRAVNRPFGSDCITAVFRRAVYDEKQHRLQQFSKPYYGRLLPNTAVYSDVQHFPEAFSSRFKPHYYHKKSLWIFFNTFKP
jgi:hypothetical protein